MNSLKDIDTIENSSKLLVNESTSKLNPNKEKAKFLLFSTNSKHGNSNYANRLGIRQLDSLKNSSKLSVDKSGEWFTTSKLNLNNEKAKYLLFGTNSKLWQSSGNYT